jgi:hypothetical protein
MVDYPWASPASLCLGSTQGPGFGRKKAHNPSESLNTRRTGIKITANSADLIQDVRLREKDDDASDSLMTKLPWKQEIK